MLFRTLLPVLALLSTMWFAPRAQAAPYTFNVDGVITNSAGVPLETAAVTFRVEIKNSTETCVLYREDQVVNMTGSNGYFSIAIGKTSNLVAGGATLEKVFSNQGANIPGESCTFTPANNAETRKFIVSFNDGVTTQVFASQEIQSVPFALEAAQASRVGNYSPGEILKADSSVDQTANSNTALSQTQYDEFWRLVKNPGTAYLTNSTSLGGDVTGAFATNTVVKIQNQAVSATVPTAGQVLSFTGGVWTPTTPAASGVTSVVANLPLSVSGSSTSTISISQAGAASDGYLSQADWNAFSNKQSSALANGKILVGNSSGVAAAVTMSGDASMDNAGLVTLANSGVSAGTYSKVTVDAKGRVTVGTNLVSSEIISMLGYTPVNKAGDVMSGNLSLVSVSSDPAGLVSADEGKMWYRSDLNTIRYWDGSAAVSLGVAGAGITNMNGLTASTQSFVIGTSGISPNFSSAGSAHTLDIPMASTAAVTAGLLSKADYDAFNAKQSTTLASGKILVGNSGNVATAVTMTGDASIDNAGALSIGAGKITAPMLSSGGVITAASGVMIAGTTGNLVNFACATSGHVLKWSVTGWTCAFADPSLPTLASGKIWVGNAGNAAAEVALSGDASVDNAGAVTLANSGVTAGSYAKVVVDAKGRVTAGQSMSASDITSALSYTPVNKAGDTMSGALAMGANDITNTGNITMAANKYFGLSSNATNGSTAGQMWYDAGTIKYFDGSAVKSLGVAGAGITNMNGLTAATQSFATGTAGPDFNISSAGSGHTFNIPTASASNRGALSSADWSTFNAKQSSTLANAMVWIGNSGNAATAVTISGDATVANTGVLTLASSGVTAGTYSKVAVDAKGRVTVGTNLVSSEIISILGYTPVNKSGDVMMGNLSLSSVTTDPGGLVAGDEGKMWYRSDLNLIKYWDGTSAVSLGVAGAGITNLNGLTASSQSFVNGTSGISPNFSSAGSAHTLNIPMASVAAVTAGLISKADYDAFNAKQSTTLASGKILVGNSGNIATAVTMTGDASIDNAGALSIGAGKITAPMLSSGGSIIATTGVVTADATGNLGRFTCSTSGHVATWSVTGWSCAAPAASLPTLMSANIWVGNSGGTATAITMSGDATMSNTGTVTLASSGATAGTYSKVTVDAKGRVTVGAAIGASEVNSALGYTPVNKAGDAMSGALAMGANDITNTGNITMAANKYFGLSSNATNGSTAGQMWYDAGTIKYFDGSTTKSLGVAGAGITNMNGLTAATQSFATGTAGPDFNISSAGSGHTFNIPTASASNRGALSSADWSTFNAKQSSTLASAQIWVGNASGGAAAVAMSGDATISNAGVMTLATTGVTPGSYPKVTVDAKGRVTGGSNLASADVTNALGYSPANSSFSFAQNGNNFGSNAVLGTNDPFDLRFKTNGTEHMTIDTAGNVGIGTTTPFAALHLYGNTSTSFIAESALSKSIIELKNNTGNGDIHLDSANNNLGFGATNYSSATGTNNTLIGIGSGGLLTTGSNNTTLGKFAMYNTTTGGYNTAIGLESMSNLISGNFNTAIGHQNAANVSTGVNNTFIGARAGFYANGASSNNIFIGYNSGPSGSTLVNNQLWIGNSSNPLIFGDFSTQKVGIGIGSSAPNSTLDMSGALTQRGIATPSLSPGGQGVIYFDSTSNKFKVSQNGSAYVDLVGGGVTSVGATAPLSSSGGTAPNISITQATTSTAGYLSSADWNAFNSKLNSNLTSGNIWVGNGSGMATAVTMTGDVSINNSGVTSVGSGKIMSEMLSTSGTIVAATGMVTANASGNLGRFTCATNGHVATWSVTGWSCAYPTPALPGLTNANIWVGNAGTATQVSMNGDATMSNAGTVTLASSGVTPGAYSKVTVDAKGRVTNGVSLANADITGALGYTPIAQGGNSFGAPMSVGTTDSNNLTLATNSAPRMTILGAGQIGIGTASPIYPLHVVGSASNTILAQNSSSVADTSNAGYFVNSTAGGGRVFLAAQNYALRFDGHIVNEPTTTEIPTVVSCGTAPSISGSDTRGTVTFGTTTNTCTINFQTPYGLAPHCVVGAASNTAGVSFWVNNTTTTQLTIATSTSVSGAKFTYICIE